VTNDIILYVICEGDFEKGDFCMHPDRWEVVDEVSGNLEGEILRGLLEAQGIETRISQEGAGKALGLGVGPLGKVQILTRAYDLDNAREILEKYYAGEFETDTFDEQPSGDDDEG
jgi:hypothetical protein